MSFGTHPRPVPGAPQRRTACCRRLRAAVVAFAAGGALGQPVPDAAQAAQQERLEEQRRALDAAPPLRPQPAADASDGPLAGEAPCIVLRRLSIEPASDSAAAPPADVQRLADLPGTLGRFAGACLGVRGLQNLQAALQARLQAAGWLTSRFSLPAQPLADGHLRLHWHAGMLAAVQWQLPDGTAVPGAAALAVRRGQVLNLRDIEQTHENLARVPSLASQFQVVPGREPDTSDLVVRPQGGRRWRGALALAAGDASGSDGPQLSLGLTVDNPLQAGDLLSLSWTQSPRRTGSQPAQASWLVHFSLPWGHDLLSGSLSGSRFARSISGGVGRFTETGTETQAQLRWQRTAWRAADQRIGLWAGLGSQQARASIDGTELRVRRRDSLRMELGAAWYRLHGCGDSNLSLEAGQAVRLRRDALFQAAADGRPAFWRLDGHWRCGLAAGGAGSGTDGWLLDLRGWLHGVRHPAGSSDLLYVGGEASVRGHRPAHALAGLATAVMRIDLHAPAWVPGESGGLLTRLQASAGLDAGHLRRALPGAAAGPRHRAGLAFDLRSQWQLAGWTGQADLGLALPLGPIDAGQARHALWRVGLSAPF